MFMINTKRIFTALLLAIIAVTGYAYDFQVDGIYYNLTNYNDAVVTHGDKKYTGSVFIPTDVKWNSRKINVVGIGDQAFKDCEELTSVILTYKVTHIGEHAFDECHNLIYVDFSHITSIGGYAFFSDCRNLESIIIPSSVNSIGISAFSECKALKDIYCQAVNVPETHSSAFDNSPIENMTLYVPGESIEAYKTTDPWSGFGKFQTLTTGIEKTETAAKPMITTANGQIAVSGLSGNATIQVLSLDGKLLDSTNATDGIATLNAQPGEVVIVKVGTESYKVVVR